MAQPCPNFDDISAALHTMSTEIPKMANLEVRIQGMETHQRQMENIVNEIHAQQERMENVVNEIHARQERMHLEMLHNFEILGKKLSAISNQAIGSLPLSSAEIATLIEEEVDVILSELLLPTDGTVAMKKEMVREELM
ncbi:hypothetical protein OIDMADRAFT_48489 [Oidiodendron maius Zn]|uniref:Uncharacterized protein n=1 Tax=Oidiodendron maius (strain Zn) TaxID=913774 RepID=A0A0C3I2L1_OIDMZ|nr:hypothetical protein OIDMADRAFT_48489 [Oidiodendron maius Zn]